MSVAEELFESLKSNEDTVCLPDESSCTIKNIRTVSVETHDGTVRKLSEV